MISIMCLFVLITALQSQSIRQKCCNEGHDIGKNSWKNWNDKKEVLICSPDLIKNNIKKLNESHSSFFKCFITAQSCCLQVIKGNVCTLGASQIQSCDDTSTELPLMMNQIKMECCMCCQEDKTKPTNDFESCSLLQNKCPTNIKMVNFTTPMPPNQVENLSSSLQKTKSFETFNYTTSGNMDRNSVIAIGLSEAPFNATESTNETVVTNSTEGFLDNNTWAMENRDDNATETIINPSPITAGISDDHKTMYRQTELNSKPTDSSRKIERNTGIIIKINNTRLSDFLTTSTRQSQLPSTSLYKTILCEDNKQWDHKLHACVQLIISCPKNFILHPDKKGCVPIISPKEPCKIGFFYDQFQDDCLDIDECEISDKCQNKTEKCQNVIGSYKCICLAGFKQNKNGVCEDIDECHDIDICTGEQKCKNTLGSYRCIRAIPCGFGWKEDPDTSDCIDVDECEEFQGICGSGMKCVNIRGSHKCEDDECPTDMKRNNRGICSRCKDGFQFNNVTNKCEDIDECSLKNGDYNGDCKDTEVCFNLLGTYECIPKMKCRLGTLLTKNGTFCEDVNECKQMRFRCETDQICINVYSSYQCIASPCAPSQQYDYTNNKCVCRDGYQMTGNNICADIDECSEPKGDRLCTSAFVCINQPGSYNCVHRSECPSGMYRSSMHSSCQDIDECETGEGKCPQNMHCVNIVSSYKCMCNRGFVLIQNNTCADVNECLLFRPEESCPDLEARCVNTAGSYKCQCPKGFHWADYPIKKCMDINECRQGNPCGKKHECINTIGSYKCKCNKGYRLAITGDSCEDIDECLLENRKCLNGFCVNLPGRYVCRCPHGFQTDKKEICEDINECLGFDGPCSGDDSTPKMCLNLLGYYKCVDISCPMEYSKRETGNGYICQLNTENHCLLKDVECLQLRPYRKIYEFIEISSIFHTRRVISVINIAHLPPGVIRTNLTLKYAHNTNTKESISVNNLFQLKMDRYNRNNIELILLRSIPAPVEILLYLEIKKYSKQMYFGYSNAFIHLYFTKYPQISWFHSFL